MKLKHLLLFFMGAFAFQSFAESESTCHSSFSDIEMQIKRNNAQNAGKDTGETLGWATGSVAGAGIAIVADASLGAIFGAGAVGGITGSIGGKIGGMAGTAAGSVSADTVIGKMLSGWVAGGFVGAGFGVTVLSFGGLIGYDFSDIETLKYGFVGAGFLGSALASAYAGAVGGYKGVFARENYKRDSELILSEKQVHENKKPN